MSSVVSPYRLDLTVSVLRRLSTNAVDLLTPEGMYVHALSGFAETTIVRATQVQAAARASITIEVNAHNDTAVLALARQMLGVDRDLRQFYRAAKRIP